MMLFTIILFAYQSPATMIHILTCLFGTIMICRMYGPNRPEAGEDALCMMN